MINKKPLLTITKKRILMILRKLLLMINRKPTLLIKRKPLLIIKIKPHLMIKISLFLVTFYVSTICLWTVYVLTAACIYIQCKEVDGSYLIKLPLNQNCRSFRPNPSTGIYSLALIRIKCDVWTGNRVLSL